MTPAPYDPDPRVDRYIEALPDWQQAICRDVRELVHAADPEIHAGETINAGARRRMFEQIVADNRAGGWRKLEREARAGRPTPSPAARSAAARAT
jgi:hypothetical protein